MEDSGPSLYRRFRTNSVRKIPDQLCTADSGPSLYGRFRTISVRKIQDHLCTDDFSPYIYIILWKRKRYHRSSSEPSVQDTRHVEKTNLTPSVPHHCSDSWPCLGDAQCCTKHPTIPTARGPVPDAPGSVIL
ncbi:hypothetical protein ElyMa_005429000, partial [Elysia marginata]